MGHKYTDLHTHIIPDVDDGSPDFAISMAVIQEAMRQGISRFFATSHSFAYIDMEESKRSYQVYEELKHSLQENEMPVEIYLGCELFCMKRLMERILDGLERGQYPSMNGTRYVLVEFTTFDMNVQEVQFCIDSLLAKGWIPIIAHMERYVDSFGSMDFVREIKAKGCLIQVSYNALCEEKDLRIRSFARDLIASEAADFMGSDTHSMNHRPPEIIEGLTYLKNHCSQAYLESLLMTNAERYLL